MGLLGRLFRPRVSKKRVDEIYAQWLEWRCNMVKPQPLDYLDSGVEVSARDFFQMVDAVGEFLQEKGKL